MIKKSTSAKTLLQAVAALIALCWVAAVEAQTTGRFAVPSLRSDAATGHRARFGALELALPKSCAAVPDSLKQLMQAQVDQAKPHGFQYEVEHVCNSADGYALVLSSIVNLEPPFNFAYLEGYEPVESGLRDSLQVRSLDSGTVALREYSFVALGRYRQTGLRRDARGRISARHTHPHQVDR